MIPFSSPLPAQEEWVGFASCASTDPEAFFPEQDHTGTMAAKRICMRCPVQPDCLDYALKHDEKWGVWGGHSERERWRLKRGEVVNVRWPRLPEPPTYTDCPECGSAFEARNGLKYCPDCRVRVSNRKRAESYRRRRKLA